MKKRHPLMVFFIAGGIGFMLSALNSNIVGVPPLLVVKNMFLSFMYNFIVGVWTGVAALFGSEIYFYIKKNLTKNERRWHICRGFCFFCWNQN
jgi:hypothetical protein